MGRKSAIKRAIIYCSSTLFAALLVVGAYVGIVIYNGNFNVVIENELYRSAQLSPQALAGQVSRYGLKTVINLRGSNPGKLWYDQEIEAARKLGINHIDFRMSARREMSKEQALELIDIMSKAPRPILIHCASGADRSGLAAAIYVAFVAKLGEQRAEEQLSLKYGHIAHPVMSQYAMDRSLEKLKLVLGIP